MQTGGVARKCVVLYTLCAQLQQLRCLPLNVMSGRSYAVVMARNMRSTDSVTVVLSPKYMDRSDGTTEASVTPALARSQPHTRVKLLASMQATGRIIRPNLVTPRSCVERVSHTLRLPVYKFHYLHYWSYVFISFVWFIRLVRLSVNMQHCSKRCMGPFL